MDRDGLIARARELHPVADVAAAAAVTDRTVYRAQRRAEPAPSLSPDAALAALADMAADALQDASARDPEASGTAADPPTAAALSLDPEPDGHAAEPPDIAEMRAGIEMLANALAERSPHLQERLLFRLAATRRLVNRLAEGHDDPTTWRELHRNAVILENGLESATTARARRHRSRRRQCGGAESAS